MTVTSADRESPPSSLSPDIRRIVRFELSTRSIITLVLAGAGVWLLIHLWPVLLMLAGALMIVGTLDPVLRWFERRGLSRGLGIATIFLTLFVITTLLLTLTLPSLAAQAMAIVDREPALRAELIAFLSTWSLGVPIANWLRTLDYVAFQGNASALETTTSIATGLAYGVSTIFLALYIMIDRDRLRGGLFAVLPRRHHIRLSRVLMNLEVIVGAYIRGQLITSVLMTVFTFGLLIALGVPNALPLAVFAGMADVLPYIGPLLSVGPPVLVALSQGPGVAALVLILMLTYEEFESRMLVPRIYGHALRLPSTIVLVALVAGGLLMGVLGALLALPLAAAAMMLIEELRVDLPGEQETTETTGVRDEDSRVEQEYLRRTEGVPAVQAAAIAVEISVDRQKAEAAALDLVDSEARSH